MRAKATQSARIEAPVVSVASSPGPAEWQNVASRYDNNKKQLLADLDLANLDKEEKVFLSTCQLIFRSERGCYTPFERYFCELVHHVGLHEDWPTPYDLTNRESFRDFVSDFDDMKKTVGRFRRQYAETLSAEDVQGS